MLGAKSKSINFSAASMVDVRDGAGTLAAIMNGVIDANGEITTTSSVKNYQVYNNNFDESEADYAEFRKWIKEERDKIYKSEGS